MGMFRFVMILAAGTAIQLAPLSQPASAADFGGMKDAPYEFVPMWTGFYLGGHGGAAMGNTSVKDQFDYVGDPNFNGGAKSTSWIAGGQAGYNFQYGHFVFGPEGDIGYLALSGKNSFFHAGDKATCKEKYDDDNFTTYYAADVCNVNAKYSATGGLYGDLTGRFGYLASRTLFYAKGGAAISDQSFKASYAGGNCTTSKSGCAWPHGNLSGTNQPSMFNFDHSETMVGWTAGAGVEYALSPSWSLKVEYQHFDFGSMSYSYSGCVPIPGTSGNNCPDGHWTSKLTNGKTDVSVTADAVTLGINYHFSNDAELK